MNNEPYKTYLNENELPTAWYNLRADMTKKPAPLLNPATLKPVTAEATGLEVFAGPTEGTAIGNLIVQMIAGGEFADLASARAAIVR